MITGMKRETAIASLTIVFFLLTAVPGFGNEKEAKPEEKTCPELKRVLEKVDDASRELQTLQAELDYRRSIPLLDEARSSTGELSFKTPEKIHMKLGQPRNEEMFSDGRTWWVVDHNARQVEIYETDDKQEIAEFSFLNLGYGKGTGRLEEDYKITLLSTEEVESVVNGKKETFARRHLMFKLRDSDSPARFGKMELKITEQFNLPEIMILYESDGEIVHRFKLQNIRLNEEIDPARFAGDVPRGYTVIRP